MPRQGIQTEDHLIPHAGSRAQQYLGVIQQQTIEQGIGLAFTATKRGFRDPSIVLRSPIKVGRAADLELEVFADPQGSALHVGWTAQEKVANGWDGMSRDWQSIKQFGANAGEAERKMRGILQAFNSLVFEPVTQMLIEASQQSQRPQSNGFLGA